MPIHFKCHKQLDCYVMQFSYLIYNWPQTVYNFPGEKNYKISAETTLDKGISEMQM